MKQLPFYIRLGFAIMGKDPYAKPEDTQEVSQKVNSHTEPPVDRRSEPQSQIAWISVNKKLPELHKKVIVYTDDFEILYGWARVNDRDYIHSTDDRTVNNVTHWMDVGTPPKAPNIKDTSVVENNDKPPRMPR
jgi:hypothetical protein